MAESSFPTGSGFIVPALRKVTSRVLVDAPISDVSDTVLTTAAAIPAVGNPVDIHATCQLVEGAGVGTTVRLKLFRDGVQLAPTTDEYAVDIGIGETTTVSCHWTDESPGENPVYSLRARGLAAVVTAQNRRLTVST